MISRIRKSMQEKDQGFTLIELLVVIIIIGILAAIAIPIFLNQQKKAQDAAAKADVSTIGKEIATYFVDWDGTTPVAIAGGNGADWTLNTVSIGNSSKNVVLATTTNLGVSDNWCVSVQNAQGDKAKAPGGFKYSAVGGLESGTC